MNDVFKFKCFSVSQRLSAMKVGTDGVLLGAWARGGDHILDIGCGTGVIALMMAQRYPHSIVQGVDIDADAADGCGAVHIPSIQNGKDITKPLKGE